MKNTLKTGLGMMMIALVFSLAAYGQETTGTIEISIKDANGAVVPNVAVTVASSGASVGYRRTMTTGDDGFVRVLQVPPGIYVITAAATSGFQETTVGSVNVTLGKTTPVNIKMLTSVSAEVSVSGSEVQPIDPTDTKIQTNITSELAELLPKGTNFSSLLKVSPATRFESKGGGFQIDGASGSENTFIIDGQEVTNVRTGELNDNSDLPFQLIQEVQVKSSGFEAEYGGATGGVINIATKGGSNQFHGEVGVMLRPSSLNAIGSPTLRLTNTGMPEYFPQQRDDYHEFNPAVTVGGPIIKNRLWFNAAFAPQFFERTRTITYLNETTRLPTGVVETYHAKQRNDYEFLRLDAQPFSRLRLSGTYTYNPLSVTGGIPSWASALSTPPILAGSNPPVTGAAYLDKTGGRQNSQNFTGQANWSITNNWILSGRIGRYFLNEKLGSYGQGNPDITRQTCSSTSTVPFPPTFGCVAGFNNGVQVISNTKYDATRRNIYDLDTTVITSFGGRHEFKGGYQYNGIANVVDIKTTDQLVYRYGWAIADYSGHAIPSSPNARGAGLLRIFSTSGDVSSKNEAIYFQDKWQPFSRLTLNLGLRTERENVPSFSPGLPGMKFSFGDKFAPRLGGAFDLTGSGKSVIKVFYGWFYDRFKYELPRGSFGGDLFHDLFYEIFDGDTYASLTRDVIFGSGHPVAGGACPTGTTTPVYGRVRCDIDYRVPSNSGLPLTEAGGIDPNIKAFRQSEFTVTFEQDLGRKFVFSSRYTHKQTDDIIEDAGFPNAEGSEFYIIGNPGEGLYRETAEAFGLQAVKPVRKYDALEMRLDRRFNGEFYFSVNYTLSRLFGNYSGLASSDEDGRTSPNVNRFFDQPQMGWTIAGGPDLGRLATDRPHVLKTYGAYRLNWKDRFGFGGGMQTDFELFFTAESGTPITSVATINGPDLNLPLTKRGDLGRTPTLSQTDIAVRHRFRFGTDNRYSIVAETDILNVFNQHTVTNRVGVISLATFLVDDPNNGLITQAQSNACASSGNQQPCLIAGYKALQSGGAPVILAAAQSAANRYALYNFASGFQGPRVVRFGFRFIF